jgi:DNA (cytosine-5)-methyltransferase 1
VIIADAHEYLLKNYYKFDFIWSSPPCPSHTSMRICWKNDHSKDTYPEMSLYQEIIFLKHFFKGKFVVENVKPYYETLIKPTIELDRHLFWSNFEIKEKVFPRLNFYKTGTTNKSMADFHNLPMPSCEDNRKVLRNCVNPNVGLHILNSIKSDAEHKDEEKV